MDHKLKPVRMTRAEQLILENQVHIMELLDQLMIDLNMGKVVLQHMNSARISHVTTVIRSAKTWEEK